MSETLPERAALYAQEGMGEIEEQMRALRRYAATHDYLIVGEYADESAGYPGRDTLLRDAGDGRFDLVLLRYRPDPNGGVTRIGAMRIHQR